ncbi:MAG: spore germination protein [Firmicutes bacterium]|nr:spore germination protein [Alicyclobacillaceae bacterium]MCL6496257.1 spore germination protein [Bacillota bacterium]
MPDLITLTQILQFRIDAWLPLFAQGPTSVNTFAPDPPAVLARLHGGIGLNQDVFIRRLKVPACPQGPVILACIDGISDARMVDQDIVAPLLTTREPPDTWDQTVFTPAHVEKARTWSQILQALAGGSTVVIAPGLGHAWVVDTVKYTQRAVERPQSEQAVRGPEESFNEVLLTQKAQLRRRFKDPALRFYDLQIGRYQHSTVSVAWLEGVANPALVETIVERLSHVRIDGYANSSTIAGIIRDHPHSVFPTIRATERVDIAVWRLLEGKAVILVDGDPFCLVAPAPLMDFYRTAMDYSSPWVDSSFIRAIRFAGWLLGLYLPPLYIALTEVNPNLIPAPLYVIIAGSHAGLPFPPALEAVLMILIIEILRESALRLPKLLSTTIGTVGAIVVGTAVVKAGLVSPQMIVVITLTALSLFSTPVYEMIGAWRFIAFALLLAGATLGLLGILLVTMGYIAEITTMQTFGTPYFTPWAPFRWNDWKDAVLRLPWSLMRTRPTAGRPVRPLWQRPVPVDVQKSLIRRRQRGF